MAIRLPRGTNRIYLIFSLALVCLWWTFQTGAPPQRLRHQLVQQHGSQYSAAAATSRTEVPLILPSRGLLPWLPPDWLFRILLTFSLFLFFHPYLGLLLQTISMHIQMLVVPYNWSGTPAGFLPDALPLTPNRWISVSYVPRLGTSAVFRSLSLFWFIWPGGGSCSINTSVLYSPLGRSVLYLFYISDVFFTLLFLNFALCLLNTH